MLVDRFGVEESAIGEREPDYNVTPRAVVPVVRERPPRRDAGPGPTTRVLSPLRWGLVPSWAESPAIGDKHDQRPGGVGRHREGGVQARVPQAPLHRPRRRVLRVAAVGADRRRRSRSAQPCWCDRRDGEPLAFAGLWEIWRDETVADRDAPGRVVAHVRDRHDARRTICSRRSTIACPSCSRGRRGTRWLDPAIDDVATLESMLAPAPDEWFETYPVSTRVNKPENNDAALLDPVGADDAARERRRMNMEPEQYLERDRA